MDFNGIYAQLSLLKLSVYAPVSYVLASRLKKYEELYDTSIEGGKGKLRQADREKSLQSLMTTNLLKRLESSVYSFRMTLTALEEKHTTMLARIEEYKQSGSDFAIHDMSDDLKELEAEDGTLKLDVRLEDETVWLSQKLMAELFQKDVRTINHHIQNIYEEGELDPAPTIRKYRIVQIEGKREITRMVDFYNLDMIISVGYRVKSHVATRFRIWATERLKEYIIKGFTLDDERLKNPNLPFDYFEELTRRIQDIRTSERRFYQKITDIYATSIDYDPTMDIKHQFFQNRSKQDALGHYRTDGRRNCSFQGGCGKTQYGADQLPGG